LVIFIDINSLIILGSTDDCLALNSIKDKLIGWNFASTEVDGHNCSDIYNKLNELVISKSSMPRILFAKTVKGKGFSIMENKANWHYWNALTSDEIELCRKEIK